MTKEELKEEFIDIYKTNIKREGADKLLDYLLTTDFFSAPASSKFHGAHEGGLCEHSINAYTRLKKVLRDELGDNYSEKYSEETIAIVGLLHDICKVNYYKVEMRNTKENGVWTQVPYYTVQDNLPYGHGEKSVYIISGFIRLTREEAMAINWHMGGFDARVAGNAVGGNSMQSAFYMFPLACMFHIADLEASYLDEKIEK